MKVIKEISLRNFKAYSNLKNVRLAPLTLIYGKNSSGKSALLHSIMQVTTGLRPLTLKTATFDLGDFQQLLYGHGAGAKSPTIGISTKETARRISTTIMGLEDITVERQYGPKGVKNVSFKFSLNPAKIVDVPGFSLPSTSNNRKAVTFLKKIKSAKPGDFIRPQYLELDQTFADGRRETMRIRPSGLISGDSKAPQVRFTKSMRTTLEKRLGFDLDEVDLGSLPIEFTGRTQDQVFDALHDHIDFSNFPPDHPRYSTERKAEFGYVKVEIISKSRS